MNSINVKAWAKVNFILNITGKRADGYHLVETVMQAVQLFDDVEIGWKPDMSCMQGFMGMKPPVRITLDPGDPELPSDLDNLAYKAALMMHEAYHPNMGEEISIKIIKRIPKEAGLGGGSADAAAVLGGLAELWGIMEPAPPGAAAAARPGVLGGSANRAASGDGKGLINAAAAAPARFGIPEKLMQIAAAIGTDIPFCLMAQRGCPAAVGFGTGTALIPIPPTDCNILIKKPDFGLSTALVYREFDPERDCKNYGNIEAFLWNAPLKRKMEACVNQLEAPAKRLAPALSETLAELKMAGNPIKVMMSGSGAACFAVYAAGSAPCGAVRTLTGKEK